MTGKELKVARKARRMSQTALGEAIGVNYKTVGAWERGTSTPHPRRAAKLHALLGIATPTTRRTLRDARVAAGLSQAELAHRIGLKTGAPISMWECGHRAVSPQYIEALERVLRPFGYGSFAKPERERGGDDATLYDLRMRAWEHGVTISAAFERFTLYQADSVPTRNIGAYLTLQGVEGHVSRLERARVSMAA